MIGAVIHAKLKGLLRDRIALALVFIMPIIFFAIFAGIFGGGGSGGSAPRVVAILVDEDMTPASKSLAESLEGSGSGLRISLTYTIDGESHPWTVEEATASVRDGKADAAIIIPRGFKIDFSGRGDNPILVLVDPSNPIAGTMIPGLLQQAAMQGNRYGLFSSGLAEFEKYGGPLTQQQRDAMKQFESMEAAQTAAANDNTSADERASLASGSAMSPVPVKIMDVQGQEAGEERSIIAYYAAGIGVMFLLFSVAGASGTLLEDQEAGILERMVCSPLGMTRLLLANWIWISIMAMVAMTVLFVFATVVFELGPWTLPRLIACFIMTVLTAAAASGLGLLLATACRTRGQLAGISTILILIMSALGGSMMPRFIMPEAVQEISWWVTFNAWAVEGYLEVFWYSTTGTGLFEMLTSMLPSFGVLAGMTLVFMVVARVLARRWERI